MATGSKGNTSATSATIATGANIAIIATFGASGTIANSTHPPVLSASFSTSCNNATGLISATIATSANTLKHLKVWGPNIGHTKVRFFYVKK